MYKVKHSAIATKQKKKKVQLHEQSSVAAGRSFISSKVKVGVSRKTDVGGAELSIPYSIGCDMNF